MAKLTRKKFLSRAAVTLAGASVLGGACTDEGPQQQGEGPNIITNKKYRWNMVTTWPPNFPILGVGCKEMAEWVKRMSGGRLSIDVFGAGELVPALESFEAVSLGTAEMANGAAYYWAGKVPAAQFFASVPFGMNAQQMTSWIVSGGGQELWDEVYKPFDIMGFPAGNTGVQMGGWFNKEINNLADLKGLKMRIPGLGGKVLTQAGGTAVNVAGGEIFTNLERGVIDATEWIGPFHDYTMGFHNIAKYYYYPGWHEAGTVLETMVNRQKFEGLPSDLQEILKTAIYRQSIWTLSEFEARNAEYLQKIREESSVEIRQFPDEVLNALKELTATVLQDMCAADPLVKKVYDSYSDFQKKAGAWSAFTEEIFYSKLQS
ncbi:MAG: TRAP transporter substrate-binding protein [Bacteroidota bacterium]